MNNYFFYRGTNQEYIRIMRDQLKLQPSLKTRAKITQKIETMSATQHFCRRKISTDYLTGTLNTESSIAFYIEDAKQTTLGVIVFDIDIDVIDDVHTPVINVHAFCTPFSGGNGKKLMNMVIQFGKKIGIEIIRLGTEASVVKFYEKMGFIIVEDYDNLFEMEYRYIRHRSPSKSKSRKSTISQRSASIFNTRSVKRRTRKTSNTI